MGELVSWNLPLTAAVTSTPPKRVAAFGTPLGNPHDRELAVHLPYTIFGF